MKKVIFALAAVVALAACSKEQTISFDKGDAIGFDTFVGKATRVDDKTLTTGNLADFAVYGAVTNTVGTDSATALIFNNVKVAKYGADKEADDYAGQTHTDWKYEGTQYWIAGAAYDFAAVAPYSCGQVDAFNALTKETTINNFTNDAVTDLLYAQTTATGAASGNGYVKFDFRHVLSKVKFSFENQYLSTGTTIRVRKIKLTNAHKTATATLDATNTAWEGHAGELSIKFGNAAAASKDALEKIAQDSELESFNVRFIIPGKNHEYTVSFLVDVLYGETVIKTYNHTASVTFTPAAGTAYDIKTVIDHTNIDPTQAQEPIEFTVNTIADWGNYNEEEAEINLPENN